MPPRLTIVLLTLNEGRNIGPLLHALAQQRRRDFEVVLLDAASTDQTVPIARGMQARMPVPLRIEVAPTRIPIGEARNRGVALARAPYVAFLSADAEPGERWTEDALRALAGADVVYGLQLHAPHAWTFSACARGLRYHFPEGRVADPLPFASNVAGVYRREVLERFPFDPAADAAEDLLLAKRAASAGYRVVYEPSLVVQHHDVDDARGEMRKMVREGRAWGLHRDELGVSVPVLAWSLALAAAIPLLLFAPASGLVALPLVLWAPALRRAALRRRSMRPLHIAKGVLASPPFDLVFAFQYVRGLAARGRGVRKERPQETRA